MLLSSIAKRGYERLFLPTGKERKVDDFALFDVVALFGTLMLLLCSMKEKLLVANGGALEKMHISFASALFLLLLCSVEEGKEDEL
ncbi:hypothetical protein SLEP1_g53968 [Rubroshorea leprosula]|uniref:Uncharacterized protein n=1 Tax=Rubroshorea leprosula TaxID=152421 RepID=A0AAV5MBV4_9ROSI|nr:hypothetical protein SLEP1_g53968 [Rubroshorea leprosula]